MAALAALDITNSARELSVVETPRVPTYRARLFALGECAVTSFQDSSFSASNFSRLWVGPGGGLFLAVLALSGPLTSPAWETSSVVGVSPKRD